MDNESATVDAALMQRDALVTLLVAQGQGLIQRLALLADSEKAAVAALVVIGQALAAYARAAQPDPEVMAGFDRMLGALAPAVAVHLTGPYPLQVCLGAPGTSAGVEAACMIRQLKALLACVAPTDPFQCKAGVPRSLSPSR
jgi:hypothetical protein